MKPKERPIWLQGLIVDGVAKSTPGRPPGASRFNSPMEAYVDVVTQVHRHWLDTLSPTQLTVLCAYAGHIYWGADAEQYKSSVSVSDLRLGLVELKPVERFVVAPLDLANKTIIDATKELLIWGLLLKDPCEWHAQRIVYSINHECVAVFPAEHARLARLGIW